MSSEFIALLANIALTLSVIVAVIFGIAQVKNSNKDRRETTDIGYITKLPNKRVCRNASLVEFIFITSNQYGF